jgi:type II secretory pathway pseudopilin PulG
MATEEPRTVIVERSRGGGMTLIAILLLGIIVAIAAFVLIDKDGRKDDAITTAAQQVGDAAQQAGDAAQEAAKKK